ncbi:MAG: D-alanyl-D-alanine carboxypeptidase [Lachnospiraceae bacterium]|nr:D-alanyl-D-alanine carboxypeptidase [Lachnospiraceae bacterium]
MRCINKHISTCCCFILAALALCGCGEASYGVPYDRDSTKSAFRFEAQDTRECADGFSAGLCIPGEESASENEIDEGPDSYAAAMLFDLKGRKTLYCRHPYERLYPASMTKVLTAVVAMENCDMDQVLVADESCVLTENDVQKIRLKPGDTMTLDQALHILLIYSANDVANLIAVNVAGSIEEFAEMMNKEALALGATNSHFMNPSGLHDEEHYTTAYDMYLIFNRAISYGKFIEIIGMSEYSTVYHGGSGEDIPFECEATNRFLNGKYPAPQNVTVIGGKTGTTQAAGACLVQLSKDASDNSYITVVMRAKTAETLYKKTGSLLELL